MRNQSPATLLPALALPVTIIVIAVVLGWTFLAVLFPGLRPVAGCASVVLAIALVWYCLYALTFVRE